MKKSYNKNKNKFVFSFFLALTILFAIATGCSGGNNPKIVNVYTGTQGVTVQFAKNNPPDEMYENSETMVLAEIWNKGAYTPGDGDDPIVVSVNVDEVYFKMTYDIGQEGLVKSVKDYLYLNLSGKSDVFPIGEKTIIPVAGLIVNKIPGTRETPTTKIGVSACYPYRTYFAESICVDTDIYGLDPNPICKNVKTFSYSGQGAPVIVSKLDVDMIPVRIDGTPVYMNTPIVNASGQFQGVDQGEEKGQNLIIKPNFRIYFTNVDTGVILAAEEGKNPCITGASSKGEAIRIKAQLGNIPLTCAKPEIKMYSNEGSVRCWLNESVSSQFDLNRNYELPLKLEAEYFYRVTATKDVKINRIS